jgi:glycosyltransferase involved in cell wall biosynthesis
LINHPDWARRLGESGRQKVLEHFNWPNIAARFREVYIRTIAKKHDIQT